MKLNSTNSLLNLYALTLIVIIFGFSNREKLTKNEYLTISVEYEFDSQLICINEGTKELRKLAAISKDIVLATKKKLKRKGFNIIETRIDNRLDNTEIIRLLNNYEEKGWRLNSHSMAVSEISEGFFIDKSKVVQYLLTREVKQ